MNWKYIKNFTPDENWGDVSRMNGLLILLLDKLRDVVDRPFIIHNAYAKSGHSKESQHYLGNAVDFHIEGISFREAFILMKGALEDLGVADSVGFGVYPRGVWNSPGFHLDVRGSKARWGGALDDAGKLTYVALDKAMERV